MADRRVIPRSIRLAIAPEGTGIVVATEAAGAGGQFRERLPIIASPEALGASRTVASSHCLRSPQRTEGSPAPASVACHAGQLLFPAGDRLLRVLGDLGESWCLFLHTDRVVRVRGVVEFEESGEPLPLELGSVRRRPRLEESPRMIREEELSPRRRNPPPRPRQEAPAPPGGNDLLESARRIGSLGLRAADALELLRRMGALQQPTPQPARSLVDTPMPELRTPNGLRAIVPPHLMARWRNHTITLEQLHEEMGIPVPKPASPGAPEGPRPRRRIVRGGL